jgi:hypothetical protein
MKVSIKLFAMLVLAAGVMFATACNKDDDEEVVPPTVKTGVFTAAADGSVEGSGEVTDDGGEEAYRGIVFGYQADPTVDKNYKKTESGTGVGKFTVKLGKGSFAPGFTYHVRAYATNSKGTSYGEDLEFTVPVK